MFQLVLTLLTTAHGNCFASSVPNFLRYYPGKFLTEPKALIEGTSRAAITKEVRVRVRQRPSSRGPAPEGGQFTSEGDSLLRSKLSGGGGGGGTILRSKLSGGALCYVVKCPGDTLLRGSFTL